MQYFLFQECIIMAGRKTTAKNSSIAGKKSAAEQKVIKLADPKNMALVTRILDR